VLDIDEIGYRAHQYTELAHRTDGNYFDVRAALEDVVVPLKPLLDYMQIADSPEFAHSEVLGVLLRCLLTQLALTATSRITLKKYSALPSFPLKKQRTPTQVSVVTSTAQCAQFLSLTADSNAT
jgi:hypothetical protein